MGGELGYEGQRMYEPQQGVGSSRHHRSWSGGGGGGGGSGGSTIST